jgi:phytoene desaturase
VASVVVIGAGMGGMAAAARLSAQGHDVTVVEQSGRAGGKVETYRRDGFAFDTGPSLLTLPAVYRDLFLKTPVRRKGASLEENVDLQGLDPAFGYRWADGVSTVLPGSNSNRVAAALGEALGGSAEDDWKRFSKRSADVWAATRVPFLESPLSGPRDLLPHLRKWADLRTVAPWKTLRGLAHQYFDDPRLVTLLDRYATYTGSDPRKAPAALAVIPFVEQTFGAWHVGGGIGQLADALYQRCLDRDIAFRFDADVARVNTVAGRASGVTLKSGEQIKADVVVSDADARHLYSSLLNEKAGRSPLRRLAKATPSLAGFVMLLAIRGRTPGLQHHNVLFPADYDAEFDAIFGRAPRPVDDPTIYVCAPDDPLMRPDDDHESWFVLVNAPRHDPDGGVNWSNPELADRYRECVLDVLAARGHDIRPRLLWSETRTPADLERTTRSPGGSIYGTSSTGVRAAFLRAANQSPVPGLFLVGGSSHPGGGLPLVGMSAAIVADLIGPA